MPTPPVCVRLYVEITEFDTADEPTPFGSESFDGISQLAFAAAFFAAAARAMFRCRVASASLARPSGVRPPFFWADFF
jgi:hypothetical protein